MIAHLAGGARTLAACVKLHRTDGTVFAYTDHDKPLTVDIADGDGAVVYQPSGGFLRSALETTARLGEVDDVTLDTFLEAGAITKADLIAGRWDKAAARFFLVNWADLTQGVVHLRRGWLGPVAVKDERASAELLGLVQATHTEVARLYTQPCPADLGDAECKVRLQPPIWAATTVYTVRPIRDSGLGSVVRPTTFNDRHFKCTTAGTSGGGEPAWNTTLGGTTNDGTVVWTAIRALTLPAAVNTVTSQTVFSLTVTTDAPDALLTNGVLTFTSGLNSGLIFDQVKSWVLATKTVTLSRPAPFTIAPADTLTITAGCNKSLAACRDTFDNVLNHRGMAYVPGDDFFKSPNAK